jgi:hypothetical protein
MPQSKQQAQDVEIINATAQDLKDYAQKVRDNKTTAKDFCQYLKGVRKSYAKEVIADLSGQTFSSIVFKGVDLGNIIASKRKMGEEQVEHPTLFQHCIFENSKFCSNTSMEGLEFTYCSMKHSSFVGDLNNVTFGIGSDISHLNLREAYNIDKCTIDPQCKISEVALGFPDLATFEQHMEQSIELQKIEKPIHRRAGVPEAPIIDRPTQSVASPALEGGRGIVGFLAGGMWRATTGVFNATVNTASYVASGVGALVTTSNVAAENDATDSIALHENAIQRILGFQPSFSPSIKSTEALDKVMLTRNDIEYWIKSRDQNNKMSLRDYIISITDDKNHLLVPHMEKLDLRGLYPNVIFLEQNLIGQI